MTLGLSVVCFSGILTLVLSYLEIDKYIDKWLFKEEVVLEEEIEVGIKIRGFQPGWTQTPRFEETRQRMALDVARSIMNRYIGEPITAESRERIAAEITSSLERFHLVPALGQRYRIPVPSTLSISNNPDPSMAMPMDYGVIEVTL